MGRGCRSFEAVNEYEPILRGLAADEREAVLGLMHLAGLSPSDPSVALLAVVAAHCRSRSDSQIAKQQADLIVAYDHLNLAIRRVWVVTAGSLVLWAAAAFVAGIIIGRCLL